MIAVIIREREKGGRKIIQGWTLERQQGEAQFAFVDQATLGTVQLALTSKTLMMSTLSLKAGRCTYISRASVRQLTDDVGRATEPPRVVVCCQLAFFVYFTRDVDAAAVPSVRNGLMTTTRPLLHQRHPGRRCCILLFESCVFFLPPSFTLSISISILDSIARPTVTSFLFSSPSSSSNTMAIYRSFFLLKERGAWRH